MNWLPRWFGRRGDASDKVASLIATVRDKQGPIYSRRRAAEELGNMGDPRAIRPLIRALKDQQYAVRMAAADSLGCLENRRAIRPLMAALKRDPDPSFARIVALALARIDSANG